ncbi:nucleotidyltransferase family protein [Parasalinivibrio latis]|uniref:nucleotidyltransferase family protein n=1 Tax=Parasalinivibrio latis TaxID=2952610 RepID=UPI0030E385FC
MMPDYQQQLTQMILSDPIRCRALECVRELNLPDCWVGAGFVRNMVWDNLHGFKTPTPLNDVDVVYFDPDGIRGERDYESLLHTMMPELNWQVKNQAFMHTRNNDRPYSDTLDAISFWVEKETCVAVRLLDTGQYAFNASYGFSSLFALMLSWNPKRPYSLFEHRVKTKGWLMKWPLLQKEKRKNN